MKKNMFIILIIVAVILVLNNKNMIRFRIISNSNSTEDQEIKYKVKDEIYPYLQELLSKSANYNDSKTIIESNITNLDNKIGNILEKNDIKQSYTINYGMNYFPEKKSDNKVYKEGNYESLVVKLGEGKGENWWCILFPPLCFNEISKEKNDKSEYKFYLFDIIKNLFK